VARLSERGTRTFRIPPIKLPVVRLKFDKKHSFHEIKREIALSIAGDSGISVAA
jgi:hypothetical protein